MLNLLKFRTRSYLKRNKSLRSSLPYKQAISVGILFTVEDKFKHESVKSFIRKLELDGKKVTVMTFLPGDKQSYEFKFEYFTARDISFWGSNTSTHAVKFAEMPFDYLFCLDTEPNPLILNLLARSKARCRVGKHFENGEPFFELMIGTSKKPEGLMDEMLNYTSLLR